MNKVHFFNPDNDLALAANVAQFTPPSNPRMLRQSGALLPLWWADEGDFVLVEDMADTTTIESFCRHNNLKARVVTKLPTDVADNVVGAPWGWSTNSKMILRRAGVTNLPSDDRLSRLRQLSHRRTSIEINRRLSVDYGLPTPPLPIEVSDETELRYILRDSRDYIAKSPWSSSGRGMAALGTMTESNAQTFASGIIKRQGSVILETPLDKAVDFAMLFRSGPDHRVCYAGLSVFTTSPAGGYASNVVAPERHLNEILNSYVSPSTIDCLKQSLELVLSDIIGSDYEGWFGVDMMIHRHNGQFAVAPAIEVNLRMTMGVVAHLLAKRFDSEKMPLYFNVSFRQPIVNSGNIFHLNPTLPNSRFSFTLSK